MASTHEGAPTDLHNPAAILAKSPMAVKEKACFTPRYCATFAAVGRVETTQRPLPPFCR
jgi:hypothetical protein